MFLSLISTHLFILLFNIIPAWHTRFPALGRMCGLWDSRLCTTGGPRRGRVFGGRVYDASLFRRVKPCLSFEISFRSLLWRCHPFIDAQGNYQGHQGKYYQPLTLFRLFLYMHFLLYLSSRYPSSSVISSNPLSNLLTYCHSSNPLSFLLSQ